MKLGKQQLGVLDALRRHKRWHESCGWIWGTPSQTAKVCESLVRRGVARKYQDGDQTVYVPVEAP